MTPGWLMEQGAMQPPNALERIGLDSRSRFEASGSSDCR
jgi:hypothetical protein